MNKKLFKLKDREFQVSRASGQKSDYSGNFCYHLDIETEEQIFDGNCWAPTILHQGLVFDVPTWHDLEGRVIEWFDADDPSYNHPEIGIIYVFGHEQTKQNRLEFGRVKDGEIEIKWSGVVNVFWDDEFGESVPFLLETELIIS